MKCVYVFVLTMFRVPCSVFRVPSGLAETFSSTLTSEEENSGMGGIAMLTLSDTENNLHFILILQGLLQHQGNGEEGGREGGKEGRREEQKETEVGSIP